MVGWIDYWKHDKGWGWVLTDEGGRFFAHISSFNPRPLAEQTIKGSIVEFDAGITTRGPVAINIRIRKATTVEIAQAAQKLFDAAKKGGEDVVC